MYNINSRGIINKFLCELKDYYNSPFFVGVIIAAFFFFCIFITGCASTAGLGKRLLQAKIVSEKHKGVLAICTRANALMYGGGNIAIVKTTKDFQGTVEVKKGCAVKITSQKAKNSTASNPKNPAEELLDTMFKTPERLIGE